MRLSKNSSGLRITLTRQEYDHLAPSEPKVFLRFNPDSVIGFFDLAGVPFDGAQAVALHKHSAKAEENFPGLLVVKWLKDVGYQALPDFRPIETSSTQEPDHHLTAGMPPAQRMSRMKNRNAASKRGESVQQAIATIERREPQPETERRQPIAGQATFHNLQAAVDLVNQLRDEIGPGVKISVGKGGRLLVNVQFGG